MLMRRLHCPITPRPGLGVMAGSKYHSPPDSPQGALTKRRHLATIRREPARSAGLPVVRCPQPRNHGDHGALRRRRRHASQPAREVSPAARARPWPSIPGPDRKLLIRPSKAAIRRVRERLANETRNLRGGNAMAVIATLNPVIRGWAAYYRGVVSSGTFSSLDDYVWKLTWKWATWRHNNKPKRWIAGQYFGKFNTFRNARWVFDDRDSGACLVKFSWTNIRRHVPVTGAASPDDPALAGYWAERRKKVRPPLDSYNLRLLTRQDGRCPLCGDRLLSAGQPPQSPSNGNDGGCTSPARR